MRASMSASTLVTVVPIREASPPSTRYDASLLAAIDERQEMLSTALDAMKRQASNLGEIVELIVTSLREGGRVLIAGNGGSAAEAQHFAAELVGRFKRDREALPAMALTADSAILTAIANDYGYEEVFARQIAAFGRRGDVLVAFSTSGESENLVRAARAAIARGIAVVAVTGGRPNRLETIADIAFKAPVDETPLAQEIHTIVLHLLCELVESSCAAQV
jgi:D-sedoheptulose 7-phosphate isomerase